jgi:hypothetical protein
MLSPSVILLFGGLDIVFSIVGVGRCEIMDVEVDKIAVREVEESEVLEDDNVIVPGVGFNIIVSTATLMPLESQHEVFPAL